MDRLRGGCPEPQFVPDCRLHGNCINDKQRSKCEKKHGARSEYFPKGTDRSLFLCFPDLLPLKPDSPFLYVLELLPLKPDSPFLYVLELLPFKPDSPFLHAAPW